MISTLAETPGVSLSGSLRTDEENGPAEEGPTFSTHG